LRVHKESPGAVRRRIGIEGEHLTVAERSRLAAMLPRGSALREAPSLIERSRMLKDAGEIQQIRAAILLGANLFDVILKTIRPGVKESEVAAELEYAARRAGAEGMSFPTIIAGGERSSLPHGQASEATIPRRGFVVCDFGVILTGYCSDMTRTVYVGRPTSEARRVYESVRRAQQAAIEAVQPGVVVGEIDRVARKLLKTNNLDRYFTHSTGHGVGLEIHEPPRVAAGQAEVLRPGMVITIEPGVYIPGKFGVRIEDMVVVTERGCQVLTPTSKTLITL
jgi:Xaa-Pro aminopeptidase